MLSPSCDRNNIGPKLKKGFFRYSGFRFSLNCLIDSPASSTSLTDPLSTTALWSVSVKARRGKQTITIIRNYRVGAQNPRKTFHAQHPIQREKSEPAQQRFCAALLPLAIPVRFPASVASCACCWFCLCFAAAVMSVVAGGEKVILSRHLVDWLDTSYGQR